MKIGKMLYPSGLLVWHDMRQVSGLRLREIIVIDETKISNKAPAVNQGYKISHSYLLVYEKV